jgi:plastocyanin
VHRPARHALVALLAALAALLGAPAGAQATLETGEEVAPVHYDGVQHLSYRYGPIDVKPGQNEIKFEPNDLKPQVPGYITRFEPNLVYADGKRGVPPVDVIHLHHGVWAIDFQPVFAAGEEKTIFQFPRGYGYRYGPEDPWIMNHMIHNLLPGKDEVYMTYDIDFVPMTAPAAQAIRPVKLKWMDVAGTRAWPVFDVKRRWARKDGKYTFPDDARTAAEKAKIGPDHRWVPDRDVTLIGTAGHLHPGGLHTDLHAWRGAEKRHLFRSEAKYWEPAGAVSWDVAMTATPPDWMVRVKRNDVLKISATYDAERASWYESMGIMPIFYYEGHDVGGTDPFEAPVKTTGEITHGRLPENDNHGGRFAILPDARKLLSARPPRSGRALVDIRDFVYRRGDLSLAGNAQRPPVVRPGQSLTFKNSDAGDDVYHTITACREPCNRDTGIAYPLADGRVDFDSGELGFGPEFATPTVNRDTWKTPKNLERGTYTYFCRVHPFMRGAFRVKGKKGRRGDR